MNRERYIELDRSGTGLTEQEWEEGWHWCNEWDGMLVGPNTDEALVCSCSHPAIEKWKESEDGKKLQQELDERSIRNSRIVDSDDPLEYFGNLGKT